MPSGVYPRTEYHCRLNSLARIGKTPWNKGKVLSPLPHCPICDIKLKDHRSKVCPLHIDWKAVAAKRPIITQQTREKLSKASKGRVMSWSMKIIESRKRNGTLGGIHSGNWKGGITKDIKYLNWLKNKRNRLKKFIEGSHTNQEWEELKKICEYTCLRCERKEPEIILTEDHIVPISKRGNNYITNIQPLCGSCNSWKHTKEINFMINGTMSLKLKELQEKNPKGKDLEEAYASAYKSLGKELKSQYPYKPEAKKMSYGSKGEAFGG